MDDLRVPRGPGLFEVGRASGETVITNVRRLAGRERPPGSALIACAAWLLAALGGGLLFVSFAGQFEYIFAARHQDVPALVEALMFDAGMIVFSLLALGLARAGRPARAERALIMACSLGSAGMNYGAADTASPRSVAAYVAAPVFLAVVADRVIAVIRRHVLGDGEVSAWAAPGRAAAAAARLAGMIVLYSLRFAFAAPETARGLRRMVLEAAPLPQAGRPAVPAAGVPAIGGPPPGEPPELQGATKKARLAWHYERDPGYGDRAAAAAAARRIAPAVGLGEGTARAYIGQILARLDGEGEAS
jgi:hypothetical protein